MRMSSLCDFDIVFLYSANTGLHIYVITCKQGCLKSCTGENILNLHNLQQFFHIISKDLRIYAMKMNTFHIDTPVKLCPTMFVI